MAVVGIDFGNLNCVIAQAGRGGVDVLLNGASKRQNSCTVSIQGKQRFMGDEASAISRSNFKNTPVNMKRMIGRQFDEPEVQEEMALLPLKFHKLEDGTVGVEVMYNDSPTVFSMEQVTAMMLTKCMDLTEKAAGAKVVDSVVCIPGYFTDAQRRSMLNACQISGLNCLRLMHEGTATALDYGIFKSAKGMFDAEKPSNVLFIDLGHASYSCTVVSFVTGKLTVRGAAFDRSLGGRDFDVVVAKFIAEEFKAKHGDDPWENTKARMKLLSAAEKAKKTLSPTGVSEVHINVECVMNDIDFQCKLTLEEYQSRCAPLLARLRAPIVDVLTQAGIPPAEFGSVELIGGSTRLGFIKNTMADMLIEAGLTIDKTALNNGLSTTMNADEAISRGCALQAAILSTRFKVKEFQIFEAVSQPIKVSWEGPASAGTEDDEEDVSGGANSVTLFKRNDETPKIRRITFERAEPFSISATYEDESLVPPGTNPLLATFQVETPEIQADAGVPKIRVNIKHNVHGIVSISSAQLMEEIKEEAKEDESKMEVDEGKQESEAKDGAAEPPKKKRYKKVDLKVSENPASGMSAERIRAAQETESQMQAQDRLIEETNNARNDVESYIYSMRDQVVDTLRPFCTDEEKAAIEESLTQAEDWLYYGDGYDATKSVYVDKLNDLQKGASKVVFRERESANRESCVQALQKSIEKYKSWLIASGSDEKYSHITEDEKSTVRAATKEHEDWLFEMLGVQASLPANVDPKLTSADLGTHLRELRDKCHAIKNRPKPAPKAEEKKEDAAKDDKPAADAPKEGEAEEQPASEEKPSEPMETDEK